MSHRTVEEMNAFKTRCRAVWHITCCTQLIFSDGEAGRVKCNRDASDYAIPRLGTDRASLAIVGTPVIALTSIKTKA